MARASRTPRLSGLGNQILLVLAHHRLASTSQLQRMLRPNTTHPHHLRRVLRQLRADGLADRVFRPGGRDSVWFATHTGTTLAQMHGGVPRRPYRMDAARAAGPLQAHALAVTEVGLLFLEHSRQSGVSLGPYSWTPEVAHRYYHDGRDRTLISDAVLDNTHMTEDNWRYDFSYAIEVDRATMPVHRLAEKIIDYRRYANYTPAVRRRGTSTRRQETPAWQKKYRWFPIVLVVLTGATAQVLQARRHALRLMLEPWSEGPNAVVPVGALFLSDLRRHGPGANIVTPLHYQAKQTTNILIHLDPNEPTGG